jgi:alpha-L-arabinofuranosidase
MFASNQGSVSLPVRIDNAPVLEAPHAAGRIGLGTWNNAAEFKDLVVASPDGKVLFKADFSRNIDDWSRIGKGEWSVQDGVLRQSAIAQDVTAFVGDTNWTDYTITLKARKLSGENGFQIYFHNKNPGQRIRWDLGGFNDSVHFMEIGIASDSIKANIETGRWYDVRLEIRGNSAKGYLDGKLVQEVADTRANLKSLCASAARDDRPGDIVLKVVNAASAPVRAQIDLKGATALSGRGKAIVLTSASPLDENTLEEPTKVAPKTETVSFSGTSLTRLFPGNSLTVIRVATSAGSATAGR